MSSNRQSELRDKALAELRSSEVLLLEGHFDYGNGYHGTVYLNPHQLFRHPSTIWRFAQDLLDILPGDLVRRVELVAGPVTGGALLAHTIAGLLDSRRSLGRAPCLFAPFNHHPSGLTLRDFYRREMAGKQVLLADDVRNTGETLARCAGLVRQAEGTVVGTVEIYDRMEAVTDLGVPNIALVEYKAPPNFPANDCPLCKEGKAITRF
jgi:orotate phosphoribosyltransferase